MVNGRAKGHQYERKIARELRNMGVMCKTSRYACREKDDQKVDLVGTEPFNIQCKAVEKGFVYHDLLKEMPQDNNMNIIMHKRNNKGEVVVMDKLDFYELMSVYCKLI